jgi:hypothetical protein
MSDEFDDAAWPMARRRDERCFDARRDRVPRVPRLVARLYWSADRPLRAKLLASLTRPLSSLGLAAVAAGAFARLLFVGGPNGAAAGIEDVAQFTNDQIIELARFVEQVSPQALQQFAILIARSPVGAAAFSASAVVLLLRALPGSSDSAHLRRVERLTGTGQS